MNSAARSRPWHRPPLTIRRSPRKRAQHSASSSQPASRSDEGDLGCHAHKIDLPAGSPSSPAARRASAGRSSSGFSIRRRGRDLGPRRRSADDRRRTRSGKVAVDRCDVTDLEDVEARARRHREGARPHRHPGQQRRHRRAERARPGSIRSDEWAQVMRVNLDGQFYLLPRRRAADDRAELRPHRQHRLDRRQGGQSERVGLFGVEGRRDRADQIARQGARAATTSRSTASRRPRRGPRSSTR